MTTYPATGEHVATYLTVDDYTDGREIEAPDGWEAVAVRRVTFHGVCKGVPSRSVLLRKIREEK